jgi:hypothetical protein
LLLYYAAAQLGKPLTSAATAKMIERVAMRFAGVIFHPLFELLLLLWLKPIDFLLRVLIRLLMLALATTALLAALLAATALLSSHFWSFPFAPLTGRQ